MNIIKIEISYWMRSMEDSDVNTQLHEYFKDIMIIDNPSSLLFYFDKIDKKVIIHIVQRNYIWIIIITIITRN